MKTARRNRRPATLDIDTPTPEQMGQGVFVIEETHDKLPGGTQITLGKGYRRKPMIDVLHGQGLFSDEQHKALKHYRHHADIADRSPLRDSLNRQRGGGTTGPTIELLNAIRVRTDCERAAGSLVDILRAVVVYDQSLSQWVISRGVSVEKCRGFGVNRVCRVEAPCKAVEIARMEIVMAAKRVQAELDA